MPKNTPSAKNGNDTYLRVEEAKGQIKVFFRSANGVEFIQTSQAVREAMDHYAQANTLDPGFRRAQYMQYVYANNALQMV